MGCSGRVGRGGGGGVGRAGQARRHEARVAQVGVRAGGARGHALAGLVAQHGVEQRAGVRVGAQRGRQQRARRPRRPARERGAVVRQPPRARPHRPARRAQRAEHAEQLVDLAVSREQRPPARLCELRCAVLLTDFYYIILR